MKTIAKTGSIGQPEKAEIDIVSLAEMSSQQRFELISILEDSPPDNVKDVLKVLMSDKDSRVRGESTRLMGDYADEKDAELLAEILLNDKDSLVRTDAAGALAGLQSLNALSALISSLTNDRNPLVRFWAASSLGESGCKELLPFVQWMKRKVRSPRVHQSLCYAAYKLGDKDSLKPLLEYLFGEDELLIMATCNFIDYVRDCLSESELSDLVIPSIRKVYEDWNHVDIASVLSRLEQRLEEIKRASNE
ncbi:MAG: HEAT repeat domain-containing protein [Fimbriimonadia bacterium]|nr:HEAT repeat domain-containing protein [Fimbriimonadia bacterium]